MNLGRPPIGIGPDGHPVIPILWVPDGSSIERVLEAVAAGSLKGKKLIQGVDPSRLQTELSQASSLWQVRLWLHSKKNVRDRAGEFRTLADCAINFKDQLEVGENCGSMSFAFPDASEFKTFQAGLDRIIQAAKDLQKVEVVRLSQSPKKWFADEVLGPIYERTFGEKPKVSKDHDRKTPAYGPFVRFVVQVMKEMGHPISPNTVASAVETGRRLRKT